MRWLNVELEILFYMGSQRDRQREDAKFRILSLLQENPELSQRALSRELGVSIGSVHFLLTAFLDKGLLKLGNFTAAEDKRRYAYVLTPKGVAAKAELTKHFLARKLSEYEILKTEIDRISSEFTEDELLRLKEEVAKK